MFEQQQRQESCNTLNQIKTLKCVRTAIGFVLRFCIRPSVKDWATFLRHNAPIKSKWKYACPARSGTQDNFEDDARYGKKLKIQQNNR